MKEKTSEPETLAEQDGNRLKNGIISWNATFAGQKPAMWDRLPDIELYMDQVVTFLDRQLHNHRRNEEDRIITASMINNYTKDHVIPRAESKKYSRDHIALLLVICSLKKVLSMPDLSDLLKDFRVNESNEIEKFYDRFREVQELAIAKTCEIVAEGTREIRSENEKEVLRNLALQLAVEAQTKCIAAEQILSILESKTDGKDKTEKTK
jgi:hypothetical protein